MVLIHGCWVCHDRSFRSGSTTGTLSLLSALCSLNERDQSSKDKLPPHPSLFTPYNLFVSIYPTLSQTLKGRKYPHVRTPSY